MKALVVGIPLTVFLTLLLLAPVQAGDRDVAELLFEKGEKAFRKRDYAEAADYYQRALDEDSPYPEAAYGLAVALEKQGQGPEALKAYLRCKDDLLALEDLTRTQKKLLDKVEKAIGKLGAGYAALEKLDEEFVKDCLAFARKYMKSDPAWAKKALESAHEVDPTHQSVIDTLERLSGVSGPASGGGGIYEPLITDDSMEGWDPGANKGFTCSGGIVTADMPADSGVTNIRLMRIEGTWSLKADFRVLEKKARMISHGLMFGRKSGMACWGVLIDWNKSLSLVKFGEKGDDTQMGFKKISGYKPERWHEIRVDVEGNKLTAYYNGEKYLEHEVDDPEEFEGMPSVFTQRGRFEFKDVGVRR